MRVLRENPLHGAGLLKKGLLQIEIDGAARGNPGPAGAGIWMGEEKGRRVREMAVYLGETTNNVAETCALILALQTALQLGYPRVIVRTDSQLLARQVTGTYRVKDQRLQWLHALIQNLQQGFQSFEIFHVPRAENRKADRLANRAVTEGLRKKPFPRRKPPAAETSKTQATLFEV